jgi:lipid-A-disaccharide synthase
MLFGGTSPLTPGPAAPVLVVAGEASGDRLAACVTRALRNRGTRTFGIGGPASAAAGMELVCDLSALTAMGTVEVAARAPALLDSRLLLAGALSEERPRAALLIDFTEYNLRLGRRLRRRGIEVLWCGAPQVWAWRRGRMKAVTRALDRLAVLLPFEVPLWRSLGIDVRYVGHPALEIRWQSREKARAALGIAHDAECVALLPGSRSQEVARHLAPMLEAFALLRRARPGLDARVIVAPSLDAGARAYVEVLSQRSGVARAHVDASDGSATFLTAFDAALSASGTATLECALAGVPPVVVYRMSSLSFALARRLIRAPFVALPNLLLGERCYPELVQDEMTPPRMASVLGEVLGARDRFARSTAELRQRLGAGEGSSTGERIADLLGPA